MYNYEPKYIREVLSYQAGEIVKHGDYNRNLNLLNVAVDNNTEALKHLLNTGNGAVLNALKLDSAVLRRHREHVLEDNDEQVPSSKAVYEHVEDIRSTLQNSIETINTTLGGHALEMFNINKRIQVVNSLIEQYSDRADYVERLAADLEKEFEFTHGTLHGGSAGQVLGKLSNDDLDYTWLDRIPGPQGEPGYTPIKGVDYFDGADGYTPVKGVDYFDGADGYTPVKGVDYFDGDDGEDGYTPVKGVDYFDGEQGPQGPQGPAIDTVPIGTGAVWHSLILPNGWLEKNGQAVSRTAYSELFAVIGTTYGAGDGSTTFNLPNEKGRVSVGRDVTQAEFDNLGETGGEKNHTLSLAEIPWHNHAGSWIDGNGAHSHNVAYGSVDSGQFIRLNANGSGSSYAMTWSGGKGNSAEVFATTAGWHGHGIGIVANGSGASHNNVQPYSVNIHIIKAKATLGVLSTTSASVIDNTTGNSTTDAPSVNAVKMLHNNENLISATLINGWTKYDEYFYTASYYKHDNIVHLSGLIKGGTLNATAFTLPVGYRPTSEHEIFPIVAGGIFGYCYVNVDGTVVPITSTNSWVSLSGISFRTD